MSDTGPKPRQPGLPAVMVWMSRAGYMGIVMVAVMMLGAAVMTGIGCYYAGVAVSTAAGLIPPPEGVKWALATKMLLLDSVDSFLFAMVMFYLAHGGYFLLLSRTADQASDLGMPDWLRVKSVGQMKRTILEVIIVLLAILFLQDGFSREGDLDWILLVFPLSIVALAVSVRIIPFDH